ncbi:MAG: hypothetical protein HY329_01655 [Chloroflexi bacterium]|nr:hypothetical protein [Chloroflexota bacterium]
MLPRWCSLLPEIRVSPGDFLEAVLCTHSGGPLLNERDLLSEWAARLMRRYEGVSTRQPLVLRRSSIPRPFRTKRFYRRLFNPNGSPTDEFFTEATEMLAVWIEETLDRPVATFSNPLHGTDPGHDAISIVLDQKGEHRLLLLQVKATEGALQRNCNDALDGFRRLEQGDFDAQILNRLTELAKGSGFPPGARPRDLMVDDQRRYRITAFHREDRTSQRILTMYSEKIPGALERRSARLGRIEDWPALWNELARIVYAQLA